MANNILRHKCVFSFSLLKKKTRIPQFNSYLEVPIDAMLGDDWASSFRSGHQMQSCDEGICRNKGLMARLTRGLSEFEDAVVAARPPRRELKLATFGPTLWNKATCVL